MPYMRDMGLRLVNDYIFLYVFGREETTEILKDLVNAVLVDAGCDPVLSLEMKNPVNIRDAYCAKETVLDICATGEDHRQFDIEMQVNNQPGFINRSLYYWAQQSPRETRLKQWIELLENAGKVGWEMKTVFSENRMISEAYEQFQRDLANRMFGAEQEGMAQGMDKGIDFARLEDAKKFKFLGVSHDKIEKL